MASRHHILGGTKQYSNFLIDGGHECLRDSFLVGLSNVNVKKIPHLSWRHAMRIK